MQSATLGKGHLVQVCCKSTHERTQNQSKLLNQQLWSRTTHQVKVEEEVSDSSDYILLTLHLIWRSSKQTTDGDS